MGLGLVQVERTGGTCLEGKNRVLGWPSDVCDGTYGDTFTSLLDVLHTSADSDDLTDLQVRIATP